MVGALDQRIFGAFHFVILGIMLGSSQRNPLGTSVVCDFCRVCTKRVTSHELPAAFAIIVVLICHNIGNVDTIYALDLVEITSRTRSSVVGEGNAVTCPRRITMIHSAPRLDIELAVEHIDENRSFRAVQDGEFLSCRAR